MALLFLHYFSMLSKKKILIFLARDDLASTLNVGAEILSGISQSIHSAFADQQFDN